MEKQNDALEQFIKKWEPMADIAFWLWVLKPTNSSSSNNNSNSLF